MEWNGHAKTVTPSEPAGVMGERLWELGWSKEMRRYYFMDKASGKSSWSRPHGCDLEIPRRPPQDSRAKSPPVPKDLPRGWKAALDRRPEVNRYYYYQANQPEIRTWYKPVASQEDVEVDDVDLSRDLLHQVATLAVEKRIIDFSQTLQLLRSERTDQGKRKLAEELLEDIFRANTELTESSPNITGSLSKQVTSSEVMLSGLCAQPSPLKPFDQMPEVTFAEVSLASAALEFWQQDRKREICVVSCGGGDMPPELCFNQETELYCQAPALKQSLMSASRPPVCPFGPAAYAGNRSDTAEMSTVVYTPDCSISRNSISEDFSLLRQGTGCSLPVLSSAAPLKGGFPDHKLSADEIKKSLSDTLTSIFVVPVLHNPRCTTLILGAWACEERFDTDTEYIATKLAELLSGKRTVEGVLIGRLYREVHFCFPKYDAGLGSAKPHHADAPIDVFKRVFEQHRVHPKLV